MDSIRLRLLLISLTTTLLSASIVITIAYFEPLPNELFGIREGFSALFVSKWQGADIDERGAKFDLPHQSYIVDATGRVMYGLNTFDVKTSCEVGSLLETSLSGAASFPQEGRRVFLAGKPYYEFTKFLKDDIRIVSRVRLYTRLEILWEFLRYFFYFFRLVLISALPIALLLSLAIARPIIRRLQRMSDTSKLFAAGNLAVRTEDKGRDEIGQLGQQFDAMATTIGSQVQELRRLAEENNQLALESEKNARRAERASLSRDLHDSVSQHLFSLAMGTSDLGNLIRRDPTKAATQAEQLRDIAAKAQDQLREVLTELRPKGLSKGLLESLLELCKSWTQRSGIEVVPTLQPLALPMILEDVLYRVAQEALNNVARHASATTVTLLLKEDMNQVVLSIRDDGHGFVNAENTTGLGLLGMRERVQSVGGTVTIESLVSSEQKMVSGTHLYVKIPLTGVDVKKESYVY